MAVPIQFNGQEGVVIQGVAYTRTQFFGVRRKCYIVLRQSAFPPHALERYDSAKSTNADLILLKNVIVNRSGERGLDIILRGSVTHHFSFESDLLALEWTGHLQALSVFEPLSFNSLYSDLEPWCFDVILLPTLALSFHGQCCLTVSETDVSLLNASNADQPIVSWPLISIRSFGIKKKKFTLKTGRSTVTGQAELSFKVLKPFTPYHVYQEVAARVSSKSLTAETHFIVSVDVVPDAYESPLLSSLVPSSALIQREENSDVSDESHVYESPLLSSMVASSSLYAQTQSLFSGYSHVEPFADEEKSGVDLPPESEPSRFPPLPGLTFQLPSISFPSVFGLQECIYQLQILLRTQPSQENLNILLYGAPRSGKRTLADALAMELEAKFISLDCLALSRGLGVGDLMNLKLTFDLVLLLTHCVVLLERVDAVPRCFKNSDEGLEVLRVVVGFLESAFSSPGLIIICASTFPMEVDDSLMMRLSKKIYVPLPPEFIRLQVVQRNLRLVSEDGEVDFVKKVAERTSGLSFSQIIEVCRELERIDITDSQLTAADRCQCLEMTLTRKMAEIVESECYEEQTEASALYFAKTTLPPGTFFVALESNRALPNVRSCFLKVTDSGLELCDLDPFDVIVTWSTKMIRGFETGVNQFSVGIGRSSPTGEGLFTFRTTEGSAIEKTIQMRCTGRTTAPTQTSL